MANAVNQFDDCPAGMDSLKSILSLLTVTILCLLERVPVMKATSSLRCMAVLQKRV